LDRLRPRLLWGTGTIVAASVVGIGSFFSFGVVNGRILDDIFSGNVAWKQVHALEDKLIDPIAVVVSWARPIV
jgi:hypothetical protein